MVYKHCASLNAPYLRFTGGFLLLLLFWIKCTRLERSRLMKPFSDFLFLLLFLSLQNVFWVQIYSVCLKWNIKFWISWKAFIFSDWMFSVRSCPALRAFAWLNLIKPSLSSLLLIVCGYLEHAQIYYLCSTSICLDFNHNRKMNWAYWPVTTSNVWASIQYTWKYLFLATFCLLPWAY